MEKTDLAVKKVRMWRKREISIYRIAKEVGVVWITVKRWTVGSSKPSFRITKMILETEIE